MSEEFKDSVSITPQGVPTTELPVLTGAPTQDTIRDIMTAHKSHVVPPTFKGRMTFNISEQAVNAAANVLYKTGRLLEPDKGSDKDKALVTEMLEAAIKAVL